MWRTREVVVAAQTVKPELREATAVLDDRQPDGEQADREDDAQRPEEHAYSLGAERRQGPS